MDNVKRTNDPSHPDPWNPEHRPRRDFLGSLSIAVRDDPVPAAMIGMGILWMFAGGGRTSLGESMTGRRTRKMAASFARRAEKAGGSALHGIETVTSSVADMAYGSVDSLAGAASKLRRVVAPSAGHENRNDYVPRGARHHGVAGDADHFQEQEDSPYLTSTWQTGIQRSVSEALERHPLILGAAGLALGAGIAASLPISVAEHQALGGASDHLRNKMQDVTDQAKNLAKAVAGEVEAQGLKTDAVRSRLNGTAGKTEAPKN